MSRTSRNDGSPPIHQSDLDQFPMIMVGRFPFLFTYGNRDSGNGTDYSPTSASSSLQQSTFSDSYEISEEMDDLRLPEEVFLESSDTNTIVIDNDIDGDDDTDAEGEELLNETVEVSHTVSQPISIQRPSGAPIPTPEEYAISQPFHHTYWSEQDRRRFQFRPIVSRRFGTQAPNPLSQIILEAGSVRTLRPNTHGSNRSRNRVQSESEDGENYSPLPDVIQFPRDRSVSLPDVPVYRCQQQEQKVGRELRRISDEFNSSFTRVRLANTSTNRASSFPMRVNIDLHACINGIRRILPSSPVVLVSRPTEGHINQQGPANVELSDLQ